MTYAAVTKSNILYQPRANIIQLIQNNLTHTNTQIYSYFPNQKASNFKGYPFIVIPDTTEDQPERYLGTDIKEFESLVEGSIFHEVKSLGDNKLRTLKQDIFETLNKKSNERILDGYNVKDVMIEFDSSSDTPILFDQNEVIEIGFTITFTVEVSFA
jgi:GTPase SAR1 family protein